MAAKLANTASAPAAPAARSFLVLRASGGVGGTTSFTVIYVDVGTWSSFLPLGQVLGG